MGALPVKIPCALLVGTDALAVCFFQRSGNICVRLLLYSCLINAGRQCSWGMGFSSLLLVIVDVGCKACG